VLCTVSLNTPITCSLVCFPGTTSSLAKVNKSSGAHFLAFFLKFPNILMFLNIQIDLLILKTYYGQFTLTTNKSLHIIFKDFCLQRNAQCWHTARDVECSTSSSNLNNTRDASQCGELVSCTFTVCRRQCTQQCRLHITARNIQKLPWLKHNTNLRHAKIFKNEFQYRIFHKQETSYWKGRQ